MNSRSATLEIELCGKLADVAGPRLALAIAERGCDAAGLLDRVARDCPALADSISRGRVRVCVNDTIVGNEAPVRAGDRVALFPPVSGG